MRQQPHWTSEGSRWESWPWRGGLLMFIILRSSIRIEPHSFQWWKLALETAFRLSCLGEVALKTWYETSLLKNPLSLSLRSWFQPAVGFGCWHSSRSSLHCALLEIFSRSLIRTCIPNLLWELLLFLYWYLFSPCPWDCYTDPVTEPQLLKPLSLD